MTARLQYDFSRPRLLARDGGWKLRGRGSHRSEIIRLNLIWIIPAKGLMRADFFSPSPYSMLVWQRLITNL